MPRVDSPIALDTREHSVEHESTCKQEHFANKIFIVRLMWALLTRLLPVGEEGVGALFLAILRLLIEPVLGLLSGEGAVGALILASLRFLFEPVRRFLSV